MLLNEANGRKTACPHLLAAYIASGGEPLLTPGAPVPEHLACKATQCMWWRWNPSGDNRRRFHAAILLHETAELARPAHVPDDWTWHPYNEEDGEPAGWVEPQASLDARRLGFCGGAVRPFED